MFNHFERIPVPVVAAAQGRCFGGGFELALRVDIIFAGESAQFRHPEQMLGITTILGGICRVAQRAGRARATQWTMTSEHVPAQVMANGVNNRVIPDGQLLTQAHAFAEQAATGPTLAHDTHKHRLHISTDGVAAADHAVLQVSVPLFDTTDVTYGLASATAAFHTGKPRPTPQLQGQQDGSASKEVTTTK